ncbi:hypothetical protein GCM10009863_40840 [Streptomyces axinellae]|uniref:Uncharacterized protein n=1 Tax=Streptomyces axinellae TaxID=552788 RepID=A0ABN3QC82_9ACTN
MGEIGERGDTGLQAGGQCLGVDPVRGDVADVERLGVGAHGAQRDAGGGEMGTLAAERIAVARTRVLIRWG